MAHSSDFARVPFSIALARFGTKQHDGREVMFLQPAPCFQMRARWIEREREGEIYIYMVSLVEMNGCRQYADVTRKV